ncbi:threonine-phosphate decarboxylase [Lachnospiraceae bacterium 45-W7]
MYRHGGDIYRHPGFLDFSANINPLGPPACVLEAIKTSAAEVYHYPQIGCTRLRQAIAELEQVRKEQIICGNGAAEVIFSLALAEKPQKALLFGPSFQEYEQALRSVDCEIVYAHVCQEEGFVWKEIPAELDDTIDMVFFCNPNNPTGVLTEGGMMKKLLERCEETDTILVVDECFMDFVDLQKQKDASMKVFLDDAKHLVLVKAFTKTFAIPGLRLGYGLCGDVRLRKRIQAVTQPWNVSVLAQEAGIAAVGEKNFLSRSRQMVEKEKKFLCEQIARFASGGKQGLFAAVYGYAANFIFFQSVPGLERELMKYKILIRDCSNFPGLCEGWYRIAVRSREENQSLAQALEQIKTNYDSRKTGDI